ncbi:ectoine hydroxylase [Paenibacillus sp. IB182496]|uniref:Ectoine hydroxylase n=1 Tax=Paenibacillus sabuli TaxID=2772509 RepID=A0A927BSU7_9BACL|nr:ectoine hydroxylase [Paenibacillus sabuli]MBD2845662.1 ectoine hydroxylase [Paenibacillus sabuli]
MSVNLETNAAVDKYPSRISDKPELLDRKDPVVYTEWKESSGVTKEQFDSYDKNGYLMLDSFFSEAEIAQWRAELARLQEEFRTKPKEEVIREPGGDEVRSIFAVHKQNEIFKKVSEHPRLKQLVDNLLGSETYIHQSRINYKPGFNGKEFYWHSDFETWHVEDGMPSMRALSCSIALEDNFHYNGALMVVPGSHKKFITCVGQTPENHYKDSLRKQEYGVPDQNSLTQIVKEGGIDTAVGKAGSILLFDCNTMHGSNSNITPLPRSNVFLVFNSVENRLVAPFSGQQPRPEYIATRD